MTLGVVAVIAPSFTAAWLWLSALCLSAAWLTFVRTRERLIPPRPEPDETAGALRSDTPAVVNMLANDANGPAGTDVSWQPDVYRMEVGAGWRVTPGVLLKTTYAFTRTDDDPVAGEHLWGTGIGWRF